jgi:hypothetical protein
VANISSILTVTASLVLPKADFGVAEFEYEIQK